MEGPQFGRTEEQQKAGRTHRIEAPEDIEKERRARLTVLAEKYGMSADELRKFQKDTTEENGMHVTRIKGIVRNMPVSAQQSWGYVDGDPRRGESIPPSYEARLGDQVYGGIDAEAFYGQLKAAMDARWLINATGSERTQAAEAFQTFSSVIGEEAAARALGVTKQRENS